MSYDLLEEKWIPVLWNDGSSHRVGITEVLTRAGRIRQIAASNPMDRLAILRFLLALLYWCKGNPPETGDSIHLFPPDWFKRLDDNKDFFNLLGEGQRFYQCHTKSGKEEKLSANYLMQEVPTGTNSWHFRHSTDKEDGLCPACAAMGLLRLPLFATSAGRGKPPGVNQKPPVYVVPVGRSLAETLRLSWCKVADTNLGTPAWEEPDLSLPKHGNVPLLVGLTSLPRRVWLENPEEPEANCISCGRRAPLIRQCVFAGVGSTKKDESGHGRIWSDPHTINNGEDVIKPSNALGATDAAAGQWARIAAGIVRQKRPNGKRGLWVVSFATVQNDKYLEAMEYEVPFPGTLDDRQVAESLETIEVWQKEGEKLARKAKPRGTSRRHLEIPPMVAAVRPDVEAKVFAKVSELISRGGDAWNQAAGEYGPMMDVVAQSLSPGYTTAALRRRHEIANARPNMQTGSARSEKAGEKKRGGK